MGKIDRNKINKGDFTIKFCGNLYPSVIIENGIVETDGFKKFLKYNRCIQNSYYCTRNINDCKIVEGILGIKADDGEGIGVNFVPHCWNSLNNIHFDITPFILKPIATLYIPYEEFTFKDYRNVCGSNVENFGFLKEKELSIIKDVIIKEVFKKK